MLASILTVFCALTLGQNDGMSQDAIARAHDQLAPALCLVSYTAEVTNPKTGETARRDGSALGLIVSSSGLVMTPGHVSFENSEPSNILVTIGQGDNEQQYNATLLTKPDDVNVCFLRMESDKPLHLPTVHFAKSTKMGIGEGFVALGLLSDTLDHARAISTGRVGAIIEKPRMTYCIDVGLRMGFVGGPVVASDGRVVGVVGMDLSSAEGGDLYTRSGQPLIYQADLFQRYIDSPPGESAGPGQEAWLGIFGQPLTDDYAEYWGVPKSGGLIVSTVMAGSPAEQAGMRPGDIITSFNGVTVSPKLDKEVIGFTKLVRDTGVGKTVAISFLREGQAGKTEVTLSARPKPARDANEYKDDVLGLTVRELTTDVRMLLNLNEDVKGVIVRRVKSGSAAELAGVRPGVIVLNVGKYTVATLADYEKAVGDMAKERPAEVALFCRIGASTGFFRVEPRWAASPSAVAPAGN